MGNAGGGGWAKTPMEGHGNRGGETVSEGQRWAPGGTLIGVKGTVFFLSTKTLPMVKFIGQFGKPQLIERLVTPLVGETYSPLEIQRLIHHVMYMFTCFIEQIAKSSRCRMK